MVSVSLPDVVSYIISTSVVVVSAHMAYRLATRMCGNVMNASVYIRIQYKTFDWCTCDFVMAYYYRSLPSHISNMYSTFAIWQVNNIRNWTSKINISSMGIGTWSLFVQVKAWISLLQGISITSHWTWIAKLQLISPEHLNPRLQWCMQA